MVTIITATANGSETPSAKTGVSPSPSRCAVAPTPHVRCGPWWTRGAGAEGSSPASLAPAFDRMYATVDRASGPPERLQASPLMALYSGCRERAFGKEVDYHLFFRWCPDMDLLERSFNANVFTWNR